MSNATTDPVKVQELWIEALRSGNYRQVDGSLTVLERNDSGDVVGTKHCCLGVLCELFLTDGGEVEVAEYDSNRSYNGSDAFPPRVVQEWAGLKANNGSYPVPGDEHSSSLSIQNDGGKSFEEIADIIEEKKAEIFE